MSKNTNKRYRINEGMWHDYLRHEALSGDEFLDNLDAGEKRVVVSGFVIYLDKRRKVSSSEIGRIMSALRQKFVTHARDVTVFNDPTVLLARKASKSSDGRKSQIERELRRTMPVTVDMIRLERAKDWVNEDIDRKMCYVGVVLGFNFMLRASEYIMDTKCNEHYIRADAVLYYGSAKRVWRSWELEGIPVNAVESILFAFRSSKSGAAKYLSLARNSSFESTVVDDMVQWAKLAKLQKGDPFCSRWKNGKRKKLTRRMMNDTLKQMATEAGLGEHTVAFHSHSLRVGGAASMIASGETRDVVKRIGGWSDNSSADRLYHRNSCHDRGALSVSDAQMKTLSADDVRRLVPPALFDEEWK